MVSAILIPPEARLLIEAKTQGGKNVAYSPSVIQDVCLISIPKAPVTFLTVPRKSLTGVIALF
jgi:hypothetical protein